MDIIFEAFECVRFVQSGYPSSPECQGTYLNRRKSARVYVDSAGADTHLAREVGASNEAYCADARVVCGVPVSIRVGVVSAGVHADFARMATAGGG